MKAAAMAGINKRVAIESFMASNDERQAVQRMLLLVTDIRDPWGARKGSHDVHGAWLREMTSSYQ